MRFVSDAAVRQRDVQIALPRADQETLRSTDPSLLPVLPQVRRNFEESFQLVFQCDRYTCYVSVCACECESESEITVAEQPLRMRVNLNEETVV